MRVPSAIGPGFTGCGKTKGREGGSSQGVWKFQDMACISKMR
jgi:hypothetical protein